MRVMVDAGFQHLLLAILPGSLRDRSDFSAPPPFDKLKAEVAIREYERHVLPSGANSRQAAPTIYTFFNISWPENTP